MLTPSFGTPLPIGEVYGTLDHELATLRAEERSSCRPLLARRAELRVLDQQLVCQLEDLRGEVDLLTRREWLSCVSGGAVGPEDRQALDELVARAESVERELVYIRGEMHAVLDALSMVVRRAG